MKNFLFIFLDALCNTPLGLQNGRLRNSRITASSEYNVYHAARLGRLGLHKRGRYVGAWCARHNNKNQWIKVDFGRTMKITKIATQGRQDAAQWVTYYRVSSSLDGVHWQVYRFKNNDKVRKCDCSWKNLFKYRQTSIYSRIPTFWTSKENENWFENPFGSTDGWKWFFCPSYQEVRKSRCEK